METVTRNPSRKANARKMSATATKPEKQNESAPVVDVPNSSQKQIAEFIKTNKVKLTEYLSATFEEISEKDVNDITKEVAECAILKRSPKKGGPWSDDTSIIEDALRAVAGPKVVALDPEEEIEEEEPVDGIEEESEAPVESSEEEVEETDEPQKALASKPSKAAKQSKTKSKAKPVKASAPKKVEAAKATKAEPKKASKSKTADKKEKSVRTPVVSADKVKTLKGKEQWFAAAKVLKSQTKLRIQTQDIEEVIGHLYEVSIGKSKLREEGFEGKGEKCYRRNRILGFKKTIEDFLKNMK